MTRPCRTTPLATSVTAVTLALMALAPRGEAYCRTTTTPAQPDPTVCPRGQAITWESGCTNYTVNPSLLPEGISMGALDALVAASAATWAGAACDASGAHPSFRLIATPDADVAVGYFPDKANYNSISFRDRWNDDGFHPADAAAVTIVTFAAGPATILDADTEINLRGPTNPRGYVFSITGESTAADLQTILTHELGHTQGLAHSPERSAVMWYSAGQGEQRRALTGDDVAGICAAYPPARRAACDPQVRLSSYAGGGLSCAAGPAPGARGAGRVGRLYPGALALALGLFARRRSA